MRPKTNIQTPPSPFPSQAVILTLVLAWISSHASSSEKMKNSARKLFRVRFHSQIFSPFNAHPCRLRIRSIRIQTRIGYQPNLPPLPPPMSPQTRRGCA
ncbi:hypothetical protein IE53DRAFT_174963 [Violaceomyces palustris]|uniref:Uncharacterized protein n=1 Tax=Violaceomyces palustris TaxID=1673888 RepID=A0ACD0NSU0_9BASI|nr:hypothetical protein IE53DRAFT_174963 [Violaceomyces palustris]